jgi:hypothetical protein
MACYVIIICYICQDVSPPVRPQLDGIKIHMSLLCTTLRDIKDIDSDIKRLRSLATMRPHLAKECDTLIKKMEERRDRLVKYSCKVAIGIVEEVLQQIRLCLHTFGFRPAHPMSLRITAP